MPYNLLFSNNRLIMVIFLSHGETPEGYPLGFYAVIDHNFQVYNVRMPLRDNDKLR